ncbi:MAG: hypothetical protein K0U41_08545 [Gammaproteobacteria bacterium]|nr:hypothetical protein [Gammaproteobacteria bacterium]
MANVDTNNVTLSFAIESTLGTLPTTPTWLLLEPNTIDTFGATLTTVAREPISRNRQRRKGVPTDLDSTVGFQTDITLSGLQRFLPTFIFASYRGAIDAIPSAVTATAYTVADPGNDIPQHSLVVARGLGLSSNNGLKVVGIGATNTSIPIVGGLTAETTAPANSIVEVAGFQGTTDDLAVVVTGAVVQITSLGAINFTDPAYDLIPGAAIFIGGTDTANRFDEAANFGYAVVVSVEALTLTIEQTALPFVSDAGTGKLIQIFVGKYLRNVPVNETGDFNRQSLQFEATYPDLIAVGTPGYEYAEGNYCNELTLNLPLTDKATMGLTFVGTDAQPPSATRRANAQNAVSPTLTGAFSTSIDIARLRLGGLDEAGLTTDFKSLTLTLSNNVSPEKVLANLGARNLNLGTLAVSVEAQMLFTDIRIPQAIRNNETFTLDFALRNDDGAAHFNMPTITLGGGGRDFPQNETVLINTTQDSFGDPLNLDISLGVTLFAFAPETAIQL